MKENRLVTLNRGALTAGTILLVGGLFVARVPILDQIELRTYDLRFLSRGPVEPSAAVVLAMIDEKSLDVEGRWPWPRTKIASLLDRLSDDGAKVIALDIGFPEPEQATDLELLDRVESTVGSLGISSPELSRFLGETRELADGDAALERAIARSSSAVVLGYFFHVARDVDYEIERDAIDRGLELIASSKYPVVAVRGAATDATASIPLAYAAEANVAALSRAARSSGYFSIKQDADAAVRWMPLVIRAGDEYFPPLSLLAAWHYLDRPQLSLNLGPYGVEGIHLGDRSIPTDESGRLLLNYYGPPKTFTHVSASDILAGAVPEGTFRDRVVLVGATATGVYDVRSTPFSPVFPGTEIHATAIENVLSRAFIAKPGWSEVYDVAAIGVLAGAAGLVLRHLGALSGLLFAAGLFASHVFFARAMFASNGVWLDVVHPLLALTVSYTALSAQSFVTEQRERRKIRNAFGQYVAPVVVEEMLKDPGRLKLGGEEKELTVLFSDLQGFTAYSERFTPQQMIELLSEYYARMTERIFAREGMLKEYVGDELMAIFGAPIAHTDHADRACLAALEMRAHRRALTEEWVKSGRPPLHARTGVNSGLMLVGNLGSEYRFAYGVLGDNVNLGSRLEGLNKEYGTEILVGENTTSLLGNGFVLREIDMVRVVGKKKPTRVYELVGATESPSDTSAAVLENYAAGLEAYRAQRWRDALALFEKVLAAAPGDGPSATMIHRCRLFSETPPSDGWDGVFEALRK